jgi:PAS domain S-box-containing protein
MKFRFDPETEKRIAAEVERRMVSRLQEEKDRTIEELETSNQELRRTNALLQSITTGTDDLIAAEDGDFRYLFFNDAYQREFKRLWGRDIEVGTSMVEAMAQWPEDQRKARELWRRALTGESFCVTMEFGPSERERQVYDLRFNPVHDAQGRQIGAAHILRKVTEQVRTQQALGESEKRIRGILESTTDGYLALDHEWRYTYFNERGARMIGMRREELIGGYAWDLFPAARGSKFYTEYHRAVETGQPVHFEEYYPEPLNMWLEVHGYPTDEGLTVFFRDITERKQAEEATRRSEEHLREVLDNLVALVGVMTPDGTLIEANRTALEMAGIRAEDVIGKPFAETYWWSWSPEVQQQLREAIQKTARGQVSRYDVKVRMAGGRLTDIDFMLAPVKDEQGRLKYMIPSALDITERKRAEEELARQRELLQTIIDNIPVYLVIWDGQLQQFQFNEAFRRDMGWTEEDAAERDFMAKVYPDPEYRLTVEEYMRSLTPGFRDLKTTAKDGRLVDISWANVSLPGDRSIGIGVNIIERKKVEEALHHAVERHQLQVRLFDGVASTTPDFVYVFDLQGRFLYANRRLLEVWGMELPDVIGKTTRELGYEQWHHDMHMREIAQVIETKRPIKGEVPFKAPRTGVFGVYEYIFTPVIGPEDEVELIAGTTRDITERKRAEEEREQLINDLSRSNQELEQFAYIASHDLQTPLRAITGFLDLLSRRYKGKLDPQADEFISFAVEGAQRMHQLINDILAYSRVGTRGKPFEHLESREPLDRALGNLQTEIEEIGVEVISDWLPMVTGDRDQLAQLFQNLVGNAIKYRRTGEPPRIHIAAEERADAWEFRVHDNGIGIDPRYAERIFQIFQRLHTVGEYPGTGIGLAICKKIVERHGGRIWVESEPGKGSTFFFTLPKQ